jgi:hypothetical protein
MYYMLFTLAHAAYIMPSPICLASILRLERFMFCCLVSKKEIVLCCLEAHVIYHLHHFGFSSCTLDIFFDFQQPRHPHWGFPSKLDSWRSTCTVYHFLTWNSIDIVCHAQHSLSFRFSRKLIFGGENTCHKKRDPVPPLYIGKDKGALSAIRVILPAMSRSAHMIYI